MDDTGSATIYVLAGCLLVGLAALVPMITGAVAVARHHAAVAADAAALAGARILERPGGTAPAACARAAAVAQANRGDVTRCVSVDCQTTTRPPTIRPETTSLQVTVRAPVSFAGLGLSGAATVAVAARAGPAGCLVNEPPGAVARRNLGPEGARAPPSGR